MAKRVSNEIGDWFQKEFWKLLQEVRDDEYPAFVHEFTDSKQARAMVRPQPSDFMIKAAMRNVHFMEVKASEKHNSLRECFSMVRDTQLSQARDITMSGGSYTVWFYSEPLNVIEVWDGSILAVHRARGTPLREPTAVFPWDELQGHIVMAFNVDHPGQMQHN